MIKDGINNSTNYQPWISYVTSENLVFNQFVDIFFFFFIVPICMAASCHFLFSFDGICCFIV